MATYCTEPSHTFSEYLLIPGYTGEGWVNLSYTKKVKGVEDMTVQEFVNSLDEETSLIIYNKAMSALSKAKESDWSIKENHWARAKEKGVVDGSAPCRPILREEIIAVLGRLGLV